MCHKDMADIRASALLGTFLNENVQGYSCTNCILIQNYNLQLFVYHSVENSPEGAAEE